jgi:hypothetical protein
MPGLIEETWTGLAAANKLQASPLGPAFIGTGRLLAVQTELIDLVYQFHVANLPGMTADAALCGLWANLVAI